MATTSPLLVSASEARRFAEDILKGHGVSAKNAAIVAHCLVAADLRGVDTHGINRIPSYIERIKLGSFNATADPTVTKVMPAVTHVDGHNGWGFVATDAGLNAAIESAKTCGIGMASIKHSNHYGMAAWAVQKAIDAGMMSLVFTNSSPAMPPWGGKSNIVGVSPIACGAPGKTPESSFILDMAPSLVARGKVRKALRRGEKIPLEWALDAEGKPTDDPAEALKGFMQPMGGPKGSALAIMMDVFSGVLSGSAFAGHVTGPAEPSKVADVGHFIVAIKADLFMDMDAFHERMQYLYNRVVQSEPATGVKRIYFPGEIERLLKEGREVGGIPYVQSEIDALNKEAEKVSVSPLQVLS